MNFKTGFQPTVEVVDPQFLYGHNEPRGLLDQLSTFMRLGTNIQVLGERRAGKTSLLKCCAVTLRTIAPNLIPVYINYRDHPLVIGYANAYRFLLASIYIEAQHHSCFPINEANLMLPTPLANPTVEGYYEVLGDVSELDFDNLFEKFVTLLSENSLGTVVLIDEYEHMMRHTFENRDGSFFRFRDLSSSAAKSPNQPKPLTYTIAGTTPWDKLCEMIGSPELNNTAAVLYVKPLPEYAFEEMWKKCVLETTDPLLQNITNAPQSVQEVYHLSGGWPFFGKLIGESLSVGIYQKESFHQALLQHFNVTWSRLVPNEKSILLEAASGSWPETSKKNPSVLRNMISRGLCEKDDEGIPFIRGLLWHEYIQEQAASQEPMKSSVPKDRNPQQETFRLLVDDISILITDINEVNLNINHTEIFRCSNHDTKAYLDLATPARNENQFTHFALSLYNILYERTTDFQPDDRKVRALERLPKTFRHKRSIVRAANSVRHHFGKGHYTRLDTFDTTGSSMDIGDVLEKYNGTRVTPQGDDFAVFQENLLKNLSKYLLELLTYVRDEAVRKTPQVKDSSVY